MRPIDWRELYASNRAVIERAVALANASRRQAPGRRVGRADVHVRRPDQARTGPSTRRRGVADRRPARLHAARLHAGRGELRRRDAHERCRRPPRVRRGLSPAGARRQRSGVLELVHARAPSTRRGRAGFDRRDRPRARGNGIAVGDRPSPRLRGRPLRGRRHGRDPGGDLSGPVRGRRGALRARVPFRRQLWAPPSPRWHAAARTPSARRAPPTPPWATTPAPSRASSCTEAPTPGSPRSTQTRCSSSQ